MLFATAAMFSILAMNHALAASNCQFHKVDASWEGSCGPLFGQTPRMTLAPAKSITTGAWRKGIVPIEVLAGEMTDSGYPNARIELEIYQGGTGVLRTNYRWLPVSGFTTKAPSMDFQVDTIAEVRPSDLDVEIIQRADAILSSTAVWNRADNRRCAAKDTTWSIYCAMQRAMVDVTGGFHHRRPADELVRTIVDERTAGKDYQHRLMDYNNDTTTHLADVHGLFVEALSRASGGATKAQRTPALVSRATSTQGPDVAGDSAAHARWALQAIQIVKRAGEILESPEKWNHLDNTKCPGDAKTFSIYCALDRASVQVAGQFHDHDGATANDRSNPFMSEAYTVAEFVAPRDYPDRLVEYNNDSTTTFADVRAFLHILQNRFAKAAVTPGSPKSE